MKVGFIVEGKTEKIIVESKKFRDYLLLKDILLCDPVIDANGNGNLLPRYLDNHVKLLRSKVPDIDQILVLTDLEQELNIDLVISRISNNNIHDGLIFVSVRAIESWFLGEAESLGKALGCNANINVRDPEIDPNNPYVLPWDAIKEISRLNGCRGPGKLKSLFAKKMIASGFDINKCIQHPNLHSVKFLDRKLSKLSSYAKKN